MNMETNRLHDLHIYYIIIHGYAYTDENVLHD